MTSPSTDTGDAGGCQGYGGYGTVAGPAVSLLARIGRPDPSHAVRAEFSIGDNTDSTLPQPIRRGGPGSASSRVAGGGTVSVALPALVPGHRYGWYARTTDGTATSPTGTVCHFYAR
ncbi:hypothetical protein [Kitasatospora sp. MBT63]|uniref:hypothetical protein n=1 Tax=Kitasatospora sp. MBT63 TaxID=1444768 RepID=UPI00053A0984|nr:hypothetical protein [Kitasatospora sp. MBT63]